MKARIGRGDALAALVIAAITGVLAALPPLDVARGLSIDVLTAMRWSVFGTRAEPLLRPVVVVAIDEESYQTPPFKGSPTLTWTREIGRVVTAIVDGGAKAVGFDIVFPASIEQSQIPFGEEPLGSRVRGFDRDFLRALASAAGAGKLVLGEVANRGETLGPSPAQRVAVRQQGNIRALNVYVDRDDVVRRLPLSFASDKATVPSMAVELAARARGVTPAFRDGGVDFDGRFIKGSVPNTMTLNFDGGADDIATYSLADLRACAEKGNREFFAEQFDGKVVILGTLLNVEDRKLTSKRFATGLEGVHAPRCILPQPAATADQFKRRTIAGVYIHATAVSNLLTDEPLVEAGRGATTAAAVGFALVVAVSALLFSPIVAAFAYLGLVAILLAVATFMFARAIALPLGEPALAGFAALALMVSYRFIVTDRAERLLRTSFGLYLAPQVIEQMVDSNALPKLGGEMRDVTVFFSDVAGFSGIAEQLTPDALVGLMNEYLSAMTDIIEQYGGYVDKYIGDSIVAVFGAPVTDPDHAANAVRAALACRERLEQLNATATAFRGHRLRHRIGLNSGEALVGNIGSRRRFNYTVMSDTVNLASRLEGANKYFDTSILAAESTVILTGDAFEWREVEAIRVKGRVQPVKIFEPQALAGEATQIQARAALVYAEGLKRWRQRDFNGAAIEFAKIADQDPPARLFLARARHHADHQPPASWEAVHALEGK